MLELHNHRKLRACLGVGKELKKTAPLEKLREPTKNPAQRPQGGDLFLFTHLLVEVSVLFIYSHVGTGNVGKRHEEGGDLDRLWRTRRQTTQGRRR